MKSARTCLAVLCIALGFACAGVVMANGALRDGPDAIMVSPATVVLDKVSDLTVHTNVPAAVVLADTVALNGVAPDSVWADDCGDLVARFAIEGLELAPGSVELTLTCLCTDGSEFSAADVVRVK